MKPARKPSARPKLHSTEAALKRAVISALRLELRGRGKVLRMQSGKLLLPNANGTKRMLSACEPGTPDLLVVLPGGRTLWIELKTEAGRITEAQHAWHDAAISLGHDVIVCRSVQYALQVVRGAMRGSAEVRVEVLP